MVRHQHLRQNLHQMIYLRQHLHLMIYLRQHLMIYLRQHLTTGQLLEISNTGRRLPRSDDAR